MVYNSGMQGIALSLETSCRAGGVSLGRDGVLLGAAELGGSGRHAAALLPACRELLREHGLNPAEVDRLYVSVGPGSFTGLRVGLTTARTWAQQQPSLAVTAVPTALAVAQNIKDAAWLHMGVCLAAKEGRVHGTLIGRDTQHAPTILGEPVVASLPELLAAWPDDVLLSGEGLEFVEAGPAAQADAAEWLPRAQSVWMVGEMLAERGETTPWPELLPVYAREPEAVRLWKKKQKN